MKLLMLLVLAVPAFAFQEEPDKPRINDGVLVVQEDLKPGLVGAYYNFGKELKKFPADLLAGQQPQLKRVDPMINFEDPEGLGFGDLQWSKQFAVVWTGVLRIPKDGSFTLYLKSDDGSRLFLDGKLIVDNDGKHRMDEDSKAVDLKAGDHDLKIEYFQNEDKAGCVLSWKYEGVDKQVVPASAFWHKFEKEVDREAK